MYSHQRFMWDSASRAGFDIICAAISMNALPSPNSSAGMDVPVFALRAAKSPMTLALFSAAEASDSASATGSIFEGAFSVAGVDIVVLVVVVVQRVRRKSAACRPPRAYGARGRGARGN